MFSDYTSSEITFLFGLLFMIIGILLIFVGDRIHRYGSAVGLCIMLLAFIVAIGSCLELPKYVECPTCREAVHSTYCPDCGWEVIVEPTCSSCGAEWDSAFCGDCGAPMNPED